LDFISWHRYSFYPQLFEKDIYQIKNWLADYSGEYELIISEWGPDSEKNVFYASSLAGAHAVSVIERVVEDWDWGMVFEVKDGPNQGKEGWGALYYDKKVKPRYKAFQMLSNMDGSYLKMEGEGSNVRGWAVKEGEEIRIVLVNYSPELMIEEIVPVKVKGLASGRYKLTIENFNGVIRDEELWIGLEIWEDEIKIDMGEVIKINLTKTKGESLGIWDYKEDDINLGL